MEDSSDEELFDARSNCNTSTNLDLSDKSKSSSDTSLLKDVSIQLTRLPNASIKKKVQKSTLHPTKKVRKLWKFGIILKKTSKKRSEKTKFAKFQSKQMTKRVKSVETAALLQDYVDQQRYLNEKSTSKEEASTSIQQVMETNVEDLQRRKEDLDSNEVYTAARTSLYNWEKCRVQTKDKVQVIGCPNAPLSLNKKNVEQDSCSFKSNESEKLETLLQNATFMKTREDATTESNTNLNICLVRAIPHTQINKWKFKRKMNEEDESDDEIDFRKKKIKKKFLISSDESSDEDVPNVKNGSCSITNSSQSCNEKVYQENLRITNDRVTRELRITLTRLEEMNDADVVKWRMDRMKNSSQNLSLKRHVTKSKVPTCNDKKASTNKNKDSCAKPVSRTILEFVTSNVQTKRKSEHSQRDESVSSEKGISMQTDIRENSSKSLKKSCTYAERYSSNGPSSMLSIRKLNKKYKLFKKPRVLLIKLENLKSSLKDGRYSAAEIDRLTRKYINIIMSITSKPKSRRLLSRGFEHLQIRETSNMNTAQTTENANAVSEKQSNGDLSHRNRFVPEESSAKDNPVLENNINESGLFKIARRFISHSSQNKLISSKNKKDSSPQKSLLEIWRNAFCSQKSTEVLQEANVKQSTSEQSISKALPIVQTSPKKSTNIERENVSVSFASTSTSSKTDDMPIVSPTKVASPKKHASVKLTNCNKILEKTTSKCVSPQSKDNVVTHDTSSSSKDAAKKNVTTRLDFSSTSRDGIPLEKTLLSSPGKSNNITVMDNMKTQIKSKMHTTQNSSNGKAQVTSCKAAYKCLGCNVQYEDFSLLQKHIIHSSCKDNLMNSLSSKIEKRMKSLKSKEPLINKLHSSNLEKLELSRQQLPIDKDSENCGFDCSSSNKDRNKDSLTPQPKTTKKSRPITKSNSDLGSQSKAIVSNFKCLSQKYMQDKVSSNKITCVICSKFFDTYLQLSKHMFKHTDSKLPNTYMSAKDNVDSTRQETNKVNDQSNFSEDAIENHVKTIEGGTNKRQKTIEGGTNKRDMMSENASKSKVNSRNTPTTQNSSKTQCDVIREDNISNLSETKRTNKQDKKERLIAVASSVERKTDDKSHCSRNDTNNIESYSKESNVSLQVQLTKSNIVCKCHSDEAVDNIQIEIVLLCVTCQTLFRRLDCFEWHLKSPEDSVCVKSPRRGKRMSKLFCSKCRLTLHSLQDMTHHLKIHTRNDHKNTVTLRCNICKMFFSQYGSLFKQHVRNHDRNPFFLATRLLFPKFSCIGSRRVTLPNVESTEIFLELSDYVCRECGLPFSTRKSLKSHESFCQDTMFTNVAEFSNNGKTVLSTKNKFEKKMQILLICGFCNKTFYNEASFQLHSLEHKKKREPHAHYICTMVNSVTKVYICKVCAAVYKSLKKFEQHWLSHDKLQEIYVCTRCDSRSDTIPLFTKHVCTHKRQQKPISCKVIYQDVCKGSNLSHTNRFEKKTATSNSKSCDSEEPRTAVNNPHASIEEIMPAESSTHLDNDTRASANGNMEAPVDISTVSEQDLSTSATVAPLQLPVERNDGSHAKENPLTINDNNGEDNSNYIDNSKEKPAVEEMSKTKENSMLNGIEKEANNSQRNATTLNEKHRSRDAASTVTQVSGCTHENSDSSTKASVITKSMTSTNASNDETSTSDKDVQNSTTADVVNSAATVITSIATTSSNETLPENVMSVVPKSFLRVKSLAELTNSPLHQNKKASENQFNFDRSDCNKSSDVNQWLKHTTVHEANNIENNKKSKQVTSANTNSTRTWPTKPQFNPAIHVSTASLMPTIIQNPFNDSVQSMTTFRPILPNNSQNNKSGSNLSNNMRDPNSRQYYIKPLRTVPVMAKQIIKPNKLVQQQHNIITLPQIVPVAPTATLSIVQSQQVPQQMSQQMPQQMLQQVSQQIPQQVSQQMPQQVSQQMPQQVSQQMPQQISQQVLQQTPPRPIYHQNLPAHIAQPILANRYRFSQPSQQNNSGTAVVTSFLQNALQFSNSSLPFQFSNQQQQQQQQQQQAIIVDNLRNYIFKESTPTQQPTINQEKSMPYQLVPASNPSNNMPANLTSGQNHPSKLNMMVHLSRDPDIYACLSCPSFKCSTVQEFSAHERSPKHEARSHYNDVPWL